MTIFDEKDFWNKKNAPHTQLQEQEKFKTQGRNVKQGLPDLRFRKKKLSQDLHKDLSRIERKGILSEYRQDL